MSKPRPRALRSARCLLLFLLAAMLAVVAFPAPADAMIQEEAFANSGLDSTDGMCSLSEAIVNANDNQSTWSDCTYSNPTPNGQGPDVILLNPTIVYQYSSALNNTDNALPVITDDVIIRSADPGVTAVIERAAGSPDFRLLEVSGDVDLTLEDITIRGGQVPGGVGGGVKFFNTSIQSEGSLTLRSTTIEGNTALLGGGVFASGIRSFVSFGSNIAENTADFHAGGVFVQADQASMTRTIVRQNVTGGRGGGVYARLPGNGVMSVLGSQFVRNSANQLGGGLFVDGDNFLQSRTMVIKSEFSLNQAAEGGGGVYLRPGGGTARVQNVTISGNRTGTPTSNAPATAGLVIDSNFSPRVDVHHVTITENIGGGFGTSGPAAAGFWSNSPNVILLGSVIAGNQLSSQAASISPRDVDLSGMTVENSLFGHEGVTTLESVGTAGVPSGNINATSDGGTPWDLPDIMGPLTAGPSFPAPLPGEPAPVVTSSHPVPALSPLVDAAGNCLSYGVHADQHFESRRGKCDIGAFEYQP